MHHFQVLVFTPPGKPDPALAIAACRSGARGGLDLEFTTDVELARCAWQRLDQLCQASFGIKLGVDSGEHLAALVADRPANWSWVVLAGGNHPARAAWIATLRQAGIEILCEAVDLSEIELAAEQGADAVLLKGHEAGGRVGEPTAFMLVQTWRRWCQRTGRELPAWLQGGIGLNTAGASMLAQVSGVVLDSQLLLARESQLEPDARGWLQSCDGSQTVVLGSRLGQMYRVVKRPGSDLVDRLQREADRIEQELPREQHVAAWRGAISAAAAKPAAQGLLLAGQDACWASTLAEQYVTVGGIVQAIAERARAQVTQARQLKPLAAGAALAASHGTQYPILQGPMTRVSDVAPFAHHVASAGGLPFLALALLRKGETEALLKQTAEMLGSAPWGVGLLGFLPPEIRREQVDAIRENPPPFALIAGGRPDQARELEALGIPTYLHVPSPGLLRMFLKDGARRFVFEGRECGGHVGPRTSFVLWETMCEALLAYLGPTGRGDDLHVVFAGGIHDDLSSAMVSVLAAPLAQRGVKIGALMGTAYLFTEEAVASGAIVPRFQQEALACRETVLLETGPGHAIRCVPTPYFDTFESERRRLEQAGSTHEEIVKSLEWMNIGRLRVASKGVDRVRNDQGVSRLVELPPEQQHERGMYMIGQVAALHEQVLSMRQLHVQVSDGASRLLDEVQPRIDVLAQPEEKPCDIAIIGMACYYPGAQGLQQYWQNILDRKYAVTEIPASHWDWRLYYDADPRTPDKIISKWGGFLDDIPFDPLPYGVTPASMKCIEPLQLILLEAVKHALGDAGYANRPFNRERTAAVLGIGGGGSPMAVAYGFRASMPLIDAIPGMRIKSSEVLDQCGERLPEWTEDSFPGFLFNVAVGRVANRFNFGGPNMAIDAACASSLAALYACVRELELGTSDVAVAMGADTVQTPFAYMAFSKTHALSRRGRCSPFDAAGDGIVLSEGIGALVLKRLADAQRDGDRIYAVIKGVGSSSDGKEKGLTCPNAQGQLRALTRAYRHAQVSPADVGLVEAHGTGTVVGDETEAAALAQVFVEAGAESQSCALGSVKSMIGHSKCAAGIAGLIKAAMALHHKVLPPTLVDTPNPKFKFDESPLYLNTESRPWIHGRGTPRHAGVSAFGFGGTNFHVVLEEYTGDFLDQRSSAMTEWPCELFVFRRSDRAALATALQNVERDLAAGARPKLGELAAACARASTADTSHPTVSIVAGSLAELLDRLPIALAAVRGEAAEQIDPRGVYFAAMPAQRGGQIGMLFPGQGSQYANMLAQLGIVFDEVRATIDQAEATLDGELDRPLGRFIYPASTFTPEAESDARSQLARTDVAQSALAATNAAMYRVLRQLGVKPDYLAGHSYGEYTALWAAGAMSDDDLFRLSLLRGRFIRQAVETQPGGMAAVEASCEDIEKLLAGLQGVRVANINAPMQTVISGLEADLKQAIQRCEQAGLRVQRIAVACAFHTPWVAGAAGQLAEAIRAVTWSPLQVPVVANASAEPYPNDTAAVTEQLAEHLTSPVRFLEQIEAMYACGVRLFVECGPGSVLTGLVRQILGDRPHLAVATDSRSRPGVTQMCHALAQLLASGVDVRLDRLFQGRYESPFALDQLAAQTDQPKLSRSTWLVNSVRCRLANDREPLLLGQSRDNVPALDRQPAPSKPQQPPPVVATAPGSMPAEGPATPLASTTPQVPSRATPSTVLPNMPFDPHSNAGAAAAPSAMSTVTPSAASSVQAPLPEPSADDALVMLRFQEVMARFLETQRAVMLGYFGAAVDTSPPLPPPSAPHMNGRAGHAPAADQAAAGRSAAEALHVSPPAPAVAPFATAETHNNGHHLNGAQAPSEPAPRSASAPVSESTAAPGQPGPALSREWLAEQLVELVSKRTGYPHDMLDLDLDLEADLGIDSIKRVEILGSLTESLGEIGDMGNAQEKLELERLTSLKSLRGIIDYLLEALGEPSAPTAAPAAASQAEPIHAGNGKAARTEVEIQRALVRLVDAPLASGGSLVLARGTVLITDDGRGVAREVADRMADFGQSCVFLRHTAGNGVHDSAHVYHADLTDPGAVDRTLDRIRTQHGPIGGLIHLLPLGQPVAESAWLARSQRDLKSLYLLARALEADLERAAGDGGAVMLAAASLDGCLGFEAGEFSSAFMPGHGGILGFTKCLAMEWSDVLVRAVDLDGSQPAAELARLLLGELSDTSGPLEVGYLGTRRVTWEPVAAPLPTDAVARPALESGDTILITGGARGITAHVARELARRYQPRLHIVGRSPLPEGEEAAETASLVDQAAIKSALIARCQRQGKPAAPAAIETEYQRLMQDREIRGNLRALRELGATVDYHAVDVRDEAAFGALIDRLQQAGGIDAVIHGAGVIEDKLVRDKTPESFDRVFGTKVSSALTLARHLDPQRLKQCVFFASIASRYGNRGQSDYAAANEVLSKLAAWLDRHWPGRVFSVAWGPWAEVGMVSHLEKHLTARGLRLISPEEGAQRLADELDSGHKGETEVIIAGGAEHVVQPAKSRSAQSPVGAV